MNDRAETLSACDYCGLPAPRAWPSYRSRSGRGPAVYCCFGCRFAAQVTGAHGEEGAAGWALARLGLSVFLSMNVMVFTMALWTQDMYHDPAANAGSTSTVVHNLFRYLALLFSLPILLLLGGPLLANAWQSLRRGILNTDLLLVTGVAAAYLYSAVSVFRDDGPVYFEVGCVVLLLVTLGRWLEATGKLRTTAALDALQKLLPDTGRVQHGDNEEEVPREQLQVGDVVRVLPGERVPCDGTAERQPVAVDEQALTGESRPAVKEIGERIFGASLVLDGAAFIRVGATAAGGVLARLIELVRQARQVKGRHERLADRVAAWFLPLVVVVSVAALLWHGLRQGWDHGVLAALAVLLIACPCALGLATPMAVWAALGRAAQVGVLFRNGAALERLAGIQALRFDKTGTLTTGTPTVAAFVVAPGEDQTHVLRLAARLASASTHIYSSAVGRFAREHHAADASPEDPTDIRTLSGRGLTASFTDGKRMFLGSERLMAEEALTWCPVLKAVAASAAVAGQSLTCLGWSERVRGAFVFHEEIRPEAMLAAASLLGLGLDVAVLTGDGAARAAALGRELGLPVSADLLPEDKVEAVRAVRRAVGPVAMVGDGLNDAPALAASDVGIAMGCGADVSRDAAAVCLLGNDLTKLPWVINLARRTVRVIRQNLFWAFAYNAAGIVLACTGQLNPVFAALAMVLSSLFVVTNSLRLGSTAVERPWLNEVQSP